MRKASRLGMTDLLEIAAMKGTTIPTIGVPAAARRPREPHHRVNRQSARSPRQPRRHPRRNNLRRHPRRPRWWKTFQWTVNPRPSREPWAQQTTELVRVQSDVHEHIRGQRVLFNLDRVRRSQCDLKWTVQRSTTRCGQLHPIDPELRRCPLHQFCASTTRLALHEHVMRRKNRRLFSSLATTINTNR